MVTPLQRWNVGVATCLTAAVVSSCGTGPSAAPPPQNVVSTPLIAQAQRPNGTHDQAALPDADDRACIGVEAVMAHITADTAHWSPTLRPFDHAIAARLAYQTRYLDHQALAASLTVRRAVAATATAFGKVADAMMARRRARLARAIAQSRTAYSGLKKVCGIHH